MLDLHERLAASLRHGFTAGALLLSLAGLSGCGLSGGGQAFEEPEGELPEAWADVFAEPREVRLAQGAPGEEILSLNYILVDGQGNLIIPDGRSNKAFFFDPSGRLLRTVGRQGQGPGEFSLLAHATLDSRERLVTFDLQGYRISTFEPPGYTYSGGFQVATAVTLLAPLADGLAIYSPYNESVVTKLDAAGKQVQAALTPKEIGLRIFLGRFQNGGIAPDGAGGLFAIYPEAFEIHHFDSALQPVKVLGGGRSSKWRPDSPRFPRSLSPYDYTPAHQRWWDSHLHIERIFNAGGDLLGVTLFVSKGLSSPASYLNLYSKEGRIVAEGLQVPHQGRVVASRDCKAWVATNASLAADGSVTPLRLYEYAVRSPYNSFCAAPPAAGAS